MTKTPHKVRTKRHYGLSVIGECLTCGKEFEDFQKRRQAYEHARNTGHKVRVEIGTTFHYN